MSHVSFAPLSANGFRFSFAIANTFQAFEIILQGRCWSAFRVNGDSDYLDRECTWRSHSFSRLVALLAWMEEAERQIDRNFLCTVYLALDDRRSYVHMYQVAISCDETEKFSTYTLQMHHYETLIPEN